MCHPGCAAVACLQRLPDIQQSPDSLSTHSNSGLYHDQHACSAVWVGQGFLPAAQGTTAQSAVTICSGRSTARIAQVSMAKWVMQLFPLLQLHFALSPGPVWVTAPHSLFPPLPLPDTCRYNSAADRAHIKAQRGAIWAWVRGLGGNLIK